MRIRPTDFHSLLYITYQSISSAPNFPSPRDQVLETALEPTSSQYQKRQNITSHTWSTNSQTKLTFFMVIQYLSMTFIKHVSNFFLQKLLTPDCPSTMLTMLLSMDKVHLIVNIPVCCSILDNCLIPSSCVSTSTKHNHKMIHYDIHAPTDTSIS